MPTGSHPSLQASLGASYGFSPLATLVSLATYVFAGSAEIRITLIMDPHAVRAAVQDMLTAVLYTLSLLKEKKVARGEG